MPRYRRIPLTREKSLQAALTSVIVGAGAAAATYVITRLMLQRDQLLPDPPRGDDPLSPPADAVSGADAEAR